MDMVLSSLQWLISHKTKPNQTKPNQPSLTIAADFVGFLSNRGKVRSICSHFV